MPHCGETCKKKESIPSAPVVLEEVVEEEELCDMCNHITESCECRECDECGERAPVGAFDDGVRGSCGCIDPDDVCQTCDEMKNDQCRCSECHECGNRIDYDDEGPCGECGYQWLHEYKQMINRLILPYHIVYWRIRILDRVLGTGYWIINS